LRIARERKAEAEARSYQNLHKQQGSTEEWEDQEWLAKQKQGDFDPDEDFM